ncbi:unnamed protein product, partial [Sphenostylis stenocarpa]
HILDLQQQVQLSEAKIDDLCKSQASLCEEFSRLLTTSQNIDMDLKDDLVKLNDNTK